VSWLGDTAGLYRRVFERGAELAVRGWPIAFAVLLYTVVLQLAIGFAAQLGIAGGLLMTVAFAACLSSWLALVEQMLRAGKVTITDLATSFGAYLGDLLAVGFLLFLLRFVASLVLAPFPFLEIVFGLATLVFFNAVPELIYLARHGAADLLVASYRFIGENWVEWFPANLLLLVIVLGTGLLVPDGPFGLVSGFAAGLVTTYAWIVRGLLFLELTTSSRRGREFKRRAAM
jgi:hypothetical protein